MGSVSVGTVSIFVCLHVGRGCVYSFACMRVGTFACVYGCLFVYVYVSGRALDSTSLIISVDPHPTTMPCRWRMPPVRWWFLAPGQDARVSAGPLSAVAWRGLALLALLGPDWGVGGLWVSGPMARSALVWSTAGGACGLAATAPWGICTVAVGGHTFGLSSALFLGGGRGCPCGGSPGGPVSWGAPGCLGPGSFHACFMPCGMGLLFPTHTIKTFTWRNLMNTSAITHTGVHSSIHIVVKNRCSTDTHCLDLLLLQNLFCNIS